MSSQHEVEMMSSCLITRILQLSKLWSLYEMNQIGMLANTEGPEKDQHAVSQP